MTRPCADLCSARSVRKAKSYEVSPQVCVDSMLTDAPSSVRAGQQWEYQEVFAPKAAVSVLNDVELVFAHAIANSIVTIQRPVRSTAGSGRRSGARPPSRRACRERHNERSLLTYRLKGSMRTSARWRDIVDQDAREPFSSIARSSST